MSKVDANGITLDRCDACGAMWFDANELERLKRESCVAKSVDTGRRGASTPDPQFARERSLRSPKEQRCPRCNEAMREHEFPDQSHIHIMTCDRCGGHLLDAGEFVDVTKYSLAERFKSFFS